MIKNEKTQRDIPLVWYKVPYEDGKLCWDVGHFSDFIIVYEGEETPNVPGGPQTGDSACLWCWIILLIIALLVFWLIIWKRRKKKMKPHKQRWQSTVPLFMPKAQ